MNASGRSPKDPRDAERGDVTKGLLIQEDGLFGRPSTLDAEVGKLVGATSNEGLELNREPRDSSVEVAKLCQIVAEREREISGRLQALQQKILSVAEKFAMRAEASSTRFIELEAAALDKARGPIAEEPVQAASGMDSSRDF